MAESFRIVYSCVSVTSVPGGAGCGRPVLARAGARNELLPSARLFVCGLPHVCTAFSEGRACDGREPVLGSGAAPAAGAEPASSVSRRRKEETDARMCWSGPHTGAFSPPARPARQPSRTTTGSNASFVAPGKWQRPARPSRGGAV